MTVADPHRSPYPAPGTMSDREAGEAERIEPHVIVLFGAAGDLTRRKILPALFHLDRAKMLPDCRIVATSLEDLDDDQFLVVARASCDEFARGGVGEEDWAGFCRRLRYVRGTDGDRARHAGRRRPG